MYNTTIGCDLMNVDLKKMIGLDEKIMWEGKPNKKCFIFESIFNPLMPFALLWAIIDFSIIGFGAFTAISEGESNVLLFLIPFFTLHLMPVWIYLFGVLMTKKRYNNTYYIITDKTIYISEGVFVKKIQTKPFAEMSHIDLRRGIFDQIFDVGDVICTSSHNSIGGAKTITNISSVSNYTEVYNIVKKLQQDIYSDIMYPNDKRPKQNNGYNTEYKG